MTLETVSDLSEYTGINPRYLSRMIHSSEQFYRGFMIPKRSGGVRIISAPYPSLMAVQRWIYNEILIPRSTLSTSAMGFRKGFSLRCNAEPHLGARYLLKMDIKDFFPSISQEDVRRCFLRLGLSQKLARWLSLLTCNNGYLPQGAPTSPMLSNVVARNLDERLERLCRHSNIVYTRYADDLTFSGNHIPLYFPSLVSRIVEESGFYINDDKTEFFSGKRKIITGVSISSGKLTIPKSIKRRIRAQVHIIEKYGLDSLIMKENNDYMCGYRLLGRLSYWHSVEPDNQYVNCHRAVVLKKIKQYFGAKATHSFE